MGIRRCPFLVFVYRCIETQNFASLHNLVQEAQQDTCGDRAADDAGHVGTHGVHEQEVGTVVLLTFDQGDTRCIGHGGDTGVTDERVDLVVALEEEVEELHEEHTGSGSNHEGEGTQHEDEHGGRSQEVGGLRGTTDGETDEDGHDIHQRTGGGVG